MAELGGDFDTDDQAAGLYNNAADSGAWTPDAWHHSPDELIAMARAQNQAGFSSAFANAGKHSNPPAWNAGREL